MKVKADATPPPPTFINHINFTISHQFLHRIFAAETIATEYLHSICRRLVCDICSKCFCDRSIIGVSNALINHPSRMVNTQSGSLNASKKLRNPSPPPENTQSPCRPARKQLLDARRLACPWFCVPSSIWWPLPARVEQVQQPQLLLPASSHRKLPWRF